MKQIVFIFLFISTFAQAQVTFYTYDQAFQPGDTVRAKVYVSGFNQITAFQWALMFDTAALRG